MTAYIWTSIAHVSGNYHDDGGLLVVASTLESARAKALAECGPLCGALTEAPSFALPLAVELNPLCVVFPNAGCC